ncbi:MAG: hypothetical protein RLZZ08_955 [Pseudomonadota bacterium]|jgi:very-short-patch-repair endonuclease
MITGPAATVKRARHLRRALSLPETILWRELRHRPGSFKFRRQHPARMFVLDFYCAAVRLAIEVDGFAHDSADAARFDAARSRFLRSQGVATLRVPAKAVLENLEACVARIVQVCSERAADLTRQGAAPLHHPADGPPPRSGEEF